ncbi:MAG: DsbE family thiol:disulfide interchange protein [Rhizobiaceae bacterium]|nr:DsbE family thiol:disulfide interchange protein [Rhizobiaceae bacterium]
MSDDIDQKPQRSFFQKLIVFSPLIIFGALAIFFYLQLTSGRNAQVLPSVLIGEKAPSIDLPALERFDLPALNDEAITGKLTLLNVWASWCVPCRQEHPFLVDLAKDQRLNIVGLNYKDKPFNAAQFLTGLGNPYTAVGVDSTGEATIDWGVYGVPETFVIAPDGTIIYKHIGPITDAALADKIMPVLEAELAKQ